jgi:PIN domain nuclease of toxin-antitoxin system
LCTFLWIVRGASDLSSRAARLYRDPERGVFLSSASAWEIAIKCGRGQMERPERYIRDERAALGIGALGIDEETALHVARLPSLYRSIRWMLVAPGDRSRVDHPDA